MGLNIPGFSFSVRKIFPYLCVGYIVFYIKNGLNIFLDSSFEF